MLIQGVEIVFGTMRCSGEFNGIYTEERNEKKAQSVLRSARDLGFTTFDTAPIYALRNAELDLGACFSHDESVRIWTKVGVSVDGTLPRRDYSFRSMQNDLKSSLERLGRKAVERVYVHNPPQESLEGCDISMFFDWVLGCGLTKSVGISLLKLKHLRATRIHQKGDCHIMCEPEELDEDPELYAPPNRLVLKSVFGGGSQLKHSNDRRSLICNRLKYCISKYKPSAILVGIRNALQLHDYEGLQSNG